MLVCMWVRERESVGGGGGSTFQSVSSLFTNLFLFVEGDNDHPRLFLVSFTQSKYGTGEWIIPTLPVICFVPKA